MAIYSYRRLARGYRRRSKTAWEFYERMTKMRVNSFRRAAAAASLTTALLLIPPVEVLGQKPGLTVRDVIELSLVTDPDARFGNEADVAVRSSPDGARFAVVTTRGLVGSNEIESSLWAIDQRTIRKALNGETETSVAPTLIARRTATSNDEVLISDVRWEPQSASILFLARDHGGARRLYRAGITENKTIVALSQDNQDVEQFDFANGTIVYSVA